MYEYVAEERTVKALVLLGVLAMVGMVVTPMAVGEFEIGWTTTTFSFAWSAGHGDPVGTTASVIAAGAAIGSLVVCPPAGAAGAALWY